MIFWYFKAKNPQNFYPVILHFYPVIFRIIRKLEVKREKYPKKEGLRILFCKPLSIKWWWRMDSNHRRYHQQIYSLPPLAARELHHFLWSG